MSQDKDNRYMVTIQVPGWELGLEGLSTVGADVQVGVWPAQQQAGQGTPQRVTNPCHIENFCGYVIMTHRGFHMPSNIPCIYEGMRGVVNGGWTMGIGG